MIKTTRLTTGIFLAVLVMALLAGCSGEQSVHEQTVNAPSDGLSAFTGVVQKATPSVVRITVLRQPTQDRRQRRGESKSRERGFEGWLKRFFKRKMPSSSIQPSQARPKVGSGFVISRDGYIVTSRDVVRGADRIMVRLANQHRMQATLVGMDKRSGIALLKIDVEDLQPVETGTVKVLKTGNWVVALGAPTTSGATATAGIVSATGRTLPSQRYVPYLQTDVVVTARNSGGPLYNTQGKVVGVSTRIPEQSGHQAFSYAIPIDMAIDVAKELMADGTVDRGWLGVQVQMVTPPLAESFDMEWPHGALVAQVIPATPAAASKLQSGDVIVEYDGQSVPNASALSPLIGMTDPGETVDIVVFREGDKRTVEVEIGSSGKQHGAGANADQNGQTLGLRMRSLTKDERRSLGIASGGARILEVRSGVAYQAGLRAGDVIMTVDSETVEGPKVVRKRLAEAEEPLALRIMRDGRVLYIAFKTDT